MEEIIKKDIEIEEMREQNIKKIEEMQEQKIESNISTEMYEKTRGTIDSLKKQVNNAETQLIKNRKQGERTVKQLASRNIRIDELN